MSRTLSIDPVTLFPTRLWQVRLGALAPRFAEWAGVVLAQGAASPAPAGRFNRMGWNSADMIVLEQPIFADLRQGIGIACDFAFKEMGLGLSPTATATFNWPPRRGSRYCSPIGSNISSSRTAMICRELRFRSMRSKRRDEECE